MAAMFGNFGEIASLLGKVKDIQEAIKKLKSELPEMEFTGFSMSGKVKAVVSGDFQLRHIEVVSGSFADVSGDEISEAVNIALADAKRTLAAKMKEASGGIDLPGMF